VLPRVTIVTPSYQNGAYIEDAICSVLTQDYPNLEYIVIDGGSTDGSVDKIRAFENRLAYWISEPDRGQAHAINKGLLRASGDILGWLNADDVLLPGAIRRIVDRFNADPSINLVYGRVMYIDEVGEPIHINTTTNPPVFSLQTMVADRNVIQPGSFWRRRAMEKAGMLDESYHFVLDYESWVRLALTGAKFARLEGEPVAQFRRSRDSKTVSRLSLFGIEELRVLDMLMQDPLLAEKTGIPSIELGRKFASARAHACLISFNGLVRTPGQRKQALGWLWKAIRYHPACVFTHWRVLASAVVGLVSIRKL